MMTRDAMPARQRLVGWYLRDYRESAGYDLAEAARILGCHRSKISRVETGQRGIHPTELRELLAGYGAGPAATKALAALARPHHDGDSWWTEYASMLPKPYLEFAAAEATASAIMTFAPVQVPELLQTPAYASAAAAADASVPEEWKAPVAAAVLTRQHVTLDERGTRLNVVIGEAALHQQAGNAAVLTAQLHHLAELAGHRRHVTIRLLPFASGLSPAGGTGGFSVLRFGPAVPLGMVYAAGPDGGLFPADPHAAIGYLRAFDHLAALALSPEATTRRLLELARDPDEPDRD
jgi:transcriptional regulator with XRE-family HTH domain